MDSSSFIIPHSSFEMGMLPSAFVGQFEKEIGRLKKRNLYRTLQVLDSAVGPIIEINGRPLLQFASNDYLGLASHPLMIKKTIATVSQFGTGMGASRLISGNHRLHQQLEEEISRFKETEAALLFSSGYLAHLGTIPSLVGRGDWVFSDALNHASIIDACRLSQAKVIIYPHRDLDALESKLRGVSRKPGTRIVIVTDGVFSMDGDLPPVKELLRLAREQEALLLVDDAHATGVIGPGGRGSAAYWNVPSAAFLTMGTFSKALGSLGGFLAGSCLFIDYLKNKARSLIYSTALPPSVCATVSTALSILKDEPQRLAMLQKNIKYFNNKINGLGYFIQETSTPIFPLIVGSEQKALKISALLWDEGIYVPAIRPPTVPKDECRLRISLMATHSREQLDKLLSVLKKTL